MEIRQTILCRFSLDGLRGFRGSNYGGNRGLINPAAIIKVTIWTESSCWDQQAPQTANWLTHSLFRERVNNKGWKRTYKYDKLHCRWPKVIGYIVKVKILNEHFVCLLLYIFGLIKWHFFIQLKTKDKPLFVRLSLDQHNIVKFFNLHLGQMC